MEKAQGIGPRHAQSQSAGQRDRMSFDVTLIETVTPQELEAAWKIAKLRRDLRSSGGWSIFWGILTISTALGSLQRSDSNTVPIFIGILLFVTGIAVRRSPNLNTLLADASALLLVGAWNIGTTLLTRDTPENLGLILGVVQTIWAIRRLARYPRFLRAGQAAESLIANTERLVTSIQETQQTDPGDLIEFQAKGQYWKGQLSPAGITLVAGNARQVRFLPPDAFALIGQDGTEPMAWIKVSINVAGNIWIGKTSHESLQRYKNWKATCNVPADNAHADTCLPIEARRVEAKQHLRQARAYEEAGDLENALAESEHALRLAPDWADAYTLHRLILERLGRQTGAIAAKKSGTLSSQTSR